MRSFLNKRKAVPEPLPPPPPLSANNETLDALSAGTPPAQPFPPLRKSATSRWKKPKKPVDTKPQLNLNMALPSTDDFRTSLLMPTFAARFSLLKEQDDPSSMLGKASDDSVLQPRRQSRMGFGPANGGLGDIPEDTSSINSSIRPPFANSRQDSYTSEEGYHSEVDYSNVMGRSRPGEGNNMFGGRQKVYMIAKAGSSSTKSLGRQVYEDDLGRSAFQQYRRQRKVEERKVSEESQGFDFGLDDLKTFDQYDNQGPMPNDSAKDLTHSPSLSSSEKKRSTNSISNSEAGSSTAATSVTSQPLTSAPSPTTATTQPVAAPAPAPTMQPMKRQDTKTRRLYEQGLDQHMHEQQSSAISRLNSIHRQRTLSNKQPPYLHNAKSTGNLHEKARQPVYAVRGPSPPPLTPSLNPLVSAKLPGSGNMSPNPSMPVSPISPNAAMDVDEPNALSQALEPGDRGKATAMGAFNKPQQSFDEEQYLERKRQLQRTSSAPAKKNPDVTSTLHQRLDCFEFERDQSDSDTSVKSRSKSGSRKHDLSKAFNVFQRAARMNMQAGAPQSDKPALPDTHRTFFGNISASDSEDEEDHHPSQGRRPLHVPDYGYGTTHGRWQPTALPAVSEHPALRSAKSKASLAEADEDSESKSLRTSQPPQSLHLDPPNKLNVEGPLDSPTLGSGAPSTPLNSLMHHLRQKSNVSSILQGDDRSSINRASIIDGRDVPELTTQNLDSLNQPIRNAVDSASRMGSTYANSNPWDLDEVDKSNHASRASISPIDSEQLNGPFSAIAGSISNRVSAVSDLEPETKSSGSWPDEPRAHHTRDTSTATQQARDDFDKELAARRAAIQETLKKEIVARDNQSREGSPAPSSNSPFRAFGMLRSKPSRESVETTRTASLGPKAMKMLGMNGAASNASGTSLDERSGKSLDLGRAREDSVPRPPLPTNHLAFQTRSRENSESSGREVLTQPARTPPSSAGRSRANSEARSGRARSRTGHYRDDLEKAMVEGTGSSAAAVPDFPPPMIPCEPTPRGSPDIIQSQFDSGRARSLSKAAATSYFDSKTNLLPIQTGSKDRLGPVSPSSLTLQPHAYSPALGSGRPSPVSSPFAQNMTPPLSGTSTPLSSTFSPPSSGYSPPFGRTGGVLQKRVVSKRDISEPVLISSTSNIDTVDLPEGASLRNGMDEPPPVPPQNPRRRTAKSIFRIGRAESDDSVATNNSRAKTPDAFFSTSPESNTSYEIATGTRSRSETLSPNKPSAKQSLEQSPAMPPPAFSGSESSERSHRARTTPSPPVPLEGGMF